MSELTTGTQHAHDLGWHSYEEAKRMAASGSWCVALPDAPNIAPEDVVIMCVGPRPDHDRYDDHACDAGGEGDARWITLTMIGPVDGETDLMTATETSFLDNYRWTPFDGSPIPIPATIAEAIGIVSGTRARGEKPHPPAAARTIADSMTAGSMVGHVQRTLPGSVLFEWYANALIVVICVLALAATGVIIDAERYAGAAGMASIAGFVAASCGILVVTRYRTAAKDVRRMPEGCAEGRSDASSYMQTSCILTMTSALLVLIMSKLLV
jgi:hypothetical protein